MTNTSLVLLTRDGGVYMSFSPALSGDQHSRLVEIANQAATAQELKDAVSAWARSEGLRLSFDP